MKPSEAGVVVRIGSPLRAFWQRLSSLLLLLTAAALLLLGKIDAMLVESVRTGVNDAIAPILGAISRPVASLTRTVEEMAELRDVQADNARLRSENANLRLWYDAALKLEAENKSLRELLNFKVEPGSVYRTARVVADTGGVFARSVLITAGRKDGIAKNQAAIAGSGLVGRVTEVGNRSGRILLITDLNSRIPVALENSRQRGVLAGDNGDQPRLVHLPPEASVTIGERVVTSGHGGVFPIGLPIGVIASVHQGVIRVQPLVDLGRLEHIRVVDYSAQVLLEKAKLSGSEP